ncbi:hypothetical protein NBRC111894_1574 [Sporolactobacillus inulinus]|uniref:Uncharacterized protein n=1 Tax=Sporolactobacillus inulinus TaxID=2078 RepID=A0A4Y1ZAF3_9BACL|nr:hypothetical protein NBRC111894_1574 [Sporolactobacillus inulinus]
MIQDRKGTLHFLFIRIPHFELKDVAVHALSLFSFYCSASLLCWTTAGKVMLHKNDPHGSSYNG